MCGFRPDAFHTFETFFVARGYHRLQFAGRDGRQYEACRIGPYPAYGYHQLEQLTLGDRGESVEFMGVLPDDFMHEKARFPLALKGIESNERYVHSITYAVVVDHGIGRSDFGQRAGNVFNHIYN